MRVHLGYVAISLNLPKVTSSSNVTFTAYQKFASREKRLDKLKSVTLTNLDDLYKILKYNVEKNIHFYRITSSLVPLATHPEVTDWDYRVIFRKDFERIGRFINENKMRVDTHPNEFNVINSAKPDVVESSIRNLWFHAHLFEDIQYPEGKMVLHVGSSEGGKAAAAERLVKNFEKIPTEIGKKIILENDDKTFTAFETLQLCKELSLPMVLDIHHHFCNNNCEPLEELLPQILSTWKDEVLPPKFHFSSPRETPTDRKHSDFIDAQDFVKFIDTCKLFDRDIDIMLEAKQKDLSLIKLMEDLKNIKKEWKFIDTSTFEL